MFAVVGFEKSRARECFKGENTPFPGEALGSDDPC